MATENEGLNEGLNENIAEFIREEGEIEAGVKDLQSQRSALRKRIKVHVPIETWKVWLRLHRKGTDVASFTSAIERVQMAAANQRTLDYGG